MLDCIAHSPGKAGGKPEPLANHLPDVRDGARVRASWFGFGELAAVSGLLHDIGKVSLLFQRRLSGAGGSVDHSTAGAIEGHRAYPNFFGSALALLVAGHHAGLADPDELARRLKSHPPEYGGWEAYAGPLPPVRALLPTIPQKRPLDWVPPGFSRSFLVRMLFSCLVDADFVATETFKQGAALSRGATVAISTLRDRLNATLANLPREGDLNQTRRDILNHVVGKAGEAPGFFTLSVPTGGGKTLASLAFALEHACLHARRRVVVVAPFTAVIEQTAAVYRDALGEPDAVLEHHSAFDWEDVGHRVSDGGDDADGLGRLRRATENWDSPIVVTTAVQFFESLYSHRTSRCRKLHNLAHSVIVLDEAQATPPHVLLPCLAALDELTRNYGATVVLCTATQPAWRIRDEALIQQTREVKIPIGLPIDVDRELAPNPSELHRRLRRTRVQIMSEEVDDASLAAVFKRSPQMLCIVNSRAHAQALFEAIKGQEGAVHLSTLMCPVHRQSVLAKVKADLREGHPVRLVATSLVESGVNLSLPTVWRARTGLDAIAQAAGRCNRERESQELGLVVVFSPAGRKVPRDLLAFEAATEVALRDGADPLAPDTMTRYFQQLYFLRGMSALDSTEIEIAGAKRTGVLDAIRDFDQPCIPFRAIGEAFQLIHDRMRPVLIPFDDTAIKALGLLASSTEPMGPLLRVLQRYALPVPESVRTLLLRRRVLRPVRRELGDTVLALEESDMETVYGRHTGFDLSDGAFRDAEENVVT